MKTEIASQLEYDDMEAVTPEDMAMEVKVIKYEKNKYDKDLMVLNQMNRLRILPNPNMLSSMIQTSDPLDFLELDRHGCWYLIWI